MAKKFRLAALIAAVVLVSTSAFAQSPEGGLQTASPLNSPAITADSALSSVAVPESAGGQNVQVLQNNVPTLTTSERSAPALPSHDLTPWGMYKQAHWVVKTVMIGLILASIATWTIWVAKSLELMGAKHKATRAMKKTYEVQSLDQLVAAAGGEHDVCGHMVSAAHNELQASLDAVDAVGAEGVKERVNSVLSRIQLGAGRRMTRGTGVLATVGSIGPFVGLFGTVWGIMNSFINIAQQQTTNLAVVAPGIAEALLATAIGLVAAIPAVVIYNVFARSIGGYRQILADVSAGIERLISRDLDYRAARRKSGKTSFVYAAE